MPNIDKRGGASCGISCIPRFFGGSKTKQQDGRVLGSQAYHGSIQSTHSNEEARTDTSIEAINAESMPFQPAFFMNQREARQVVTKYAERTYVPPSQAATPRLNDEFAFTRLKSSALRNLAVRRRSSDISTSVSSTLSGRVGSDYSFHDHSTGWDNGGLMHSMGGYTQGHTKGLSRLTSHADDLSAGGTQRADTMQAVAKAERALGLAPGQLTSSILKAHNSGTVLRASSGGSPLLMEGTRDNGRLRRSSSDATTATTIVSDTPTGQKSQAMQLTYMDDARKLAGHNSTHGRVTMSDWSPTAASISSMDSNNNRSTAITAKNLSRQSSTASINSRNNLSRQSSVNSVVWVDGDISRGPSASSIHRKPILRSPSFGAVASGKVQVDATERELYSYLGIDGMMTGERVDGRVDGSVSPLTPGAHNVTASSSSNNKSNSNNNYNKSKNSSNSGISSSATRSTMTMQDRPTRSTMTSVAPRANEDLQANILALSEWSRAGHGAVASTGHGAVASAGHSAVASTPRGSFQPVKVYDDAFNQQHHAHAHAHARPTLRHSLSMPDEPHVYDDEGTRSQSHTIPSLAASGQTRQLQQKQQQQQERYNQGAFTFEAEIGFVTPSVAPPPRKHNNDGNLTDRGSLTDRGCTDAHVAEEDVGPRAPARRLHRGWSDA